MKILSPWIHELDNGLYAVRTDTESMWLKTTDFYAAVHMCSLIKDFQIKFQAAVDVVIKMEGQLTGHILLTDEVE